MGNNRSYYSDDIKGFLTKTNNEIIGEMTQNNQFDLTGLQRYAWNEEIIIFREQLSSFKHGMLMLEYSIPRIGKRVDAVFLYAGIVFLLEFKVGDSEYRNAAFDQVMDYALDLKNFQKESYDKLIVPIVVSTEAASYANELFKYEDKILQPIGANKHNISEIINKVVSHFSEPTFNYKKWENSEYLPTPTIIEAAQALYANHSVAEITRQDAGVTNLTVTTEEIQKIISYSMGKKRRSIVFVTGVPGAGKTLVGLNLASRYQDSEFGEHAVFLSGNQPLVSVLQEALVRDKVSRSRESGNPINKQTAYREVFSFIQIIHHYRDEYVGNMRIPTERIAIFDESQRAWTKEEISSFMARKKGIKDFLYSEPEFLISTMDRLPDWAVIICLIGGGQEINKGEAGMPEWFDSLRRSFQNWDVYVSERLNDEEYLRSRSWESLIRGLNTTTLKSLHLATSIRSFRSEKVSALVKAILDKNLTQAQQLYSEVSSCYPIVLTRDINKAKSWVRNKARGSERYGIFASSNAARLKPYGVHYAKDRSSISPENWFLNGKDDIRSSFFLEVVASEFETQGLELDFAIVAWDADFRIENGGWAYYFMSNRMTPPNWSRIRSSNNITYLINAYRVLLTRARQGFVIYIPEGTTEDKTRLPQYYDGTYNYLKQIGIKEI